jgi:type IX secretion system PorP/SprF family membrane protein
MDTVKTVRKTFAVLIISLLIGTAVNSQDIHFTQFFNNPSTLNPALTGFTNSKMRLFLTHRNQWGAVSVPFQTYSAAIDAQLLKRKQKGDMLGIGFSAFSDKAGDSKFGTQELQMSVSYVKALGNSNRNLLGFGVHMGYVQRSLDYNALYFDNQYNGSYFDPKLNTGEKFAVDNYSYTDLSAGVNWFTNISYDFKLQTGLSVWHLNRPNQSLKDDNTVKLSIKGVFYSEAEITLSRPYHLMPAIFIQRQGTFTEIFIGSRFKYIINQKAFDYSAFITGIFYRNKDAVALFTGFEYKSMNIGFSYDFNISSLRVASNYLGGMEVSFSWKLDRERHPKPKDLPCPIF